MTPKIEPIITNKTKEIATFMANILSAVKNDGFIPPPHEQSGISDDTEQTIKQTSVIKKKGRYITRRLISPSVSYLAINAQEYSPHTNPSVKNGKNIKNTVLLFVPAINTTKYPPKSAVRVIKNTLNAPNSISALATLSKSPSTERTQATTPAITPTINATSVQIITFLFFEKYVLSQDMTDCVRIELAIRKHTPIKRHI